jgi:DNA polymerase-3 subunit beta
MKTQLTLIKKIAKNRAIDIIDGRVLIDGRGLTASNLETFLTFPLSNGWTIQGAGVLPVAILDTVKNAREVEVNFNGSSAEITFDGIKMKSDYLSADDYPYPPDTLNMLADGEIPGAVIGSVLEFLGKDTLRDALTGAYIGPDAVGTNGHILKFVPINYAGTPFILRREVVEALKICGKDKKIPGTWKIRQNTNYALFYNSFGQFITRKIDATYPNYKSIIPQNNDGLIKLNKGALESVLKDMTGVLNKNTKLVELSVNDAGSVNFYGCNIDAGTELSRSMPGEVRNLTTGFKIGFNADYLKTMCSNVVTDEISFNLSTPNRAGIINNELLIMPVMLS